MTTRYGRWTNAGSSPTSSCPKTVRKPCRGERRGVGRAVVAAFGSGHGFVSAGTIVRSSNPRRIRPAPSPTDSRRLPPTSARSSPPADVDPDLGGGTLEDHPVDDALHDVRPAAVLAVVEEADVLGAEVGDDRVADRQPLAGVGAQRQVADPDGRPAVLAGPVDGLDRPLEAVVRADELGHEPGLRLEVDVGLRPDLLDAARVHHDDPVGDRERLGLVVGDVHGGLAGPPLEVEDRVLQRVAEVPVERRQGLVEQQDPRVRGEDAGQGDPLLLAAGELGRQPPAVARQADHRQHLLDPAADRVLLRALDRQPERHVVGDRQVREQGRRLEHEADVPLPRRQERHVVGVEVDPPVGRLDQPGDHPQRRRLAAARRPEQRDHLAVGDLEVEGVDGDGRAVVLGDRGQPDGRHQRMYVPLK